MRKHTAGHQAICRPWHHTKEYNPMIAIQMSIDGKFAQGAHEQLQYNLIFRGG